MEDDDRQTQIAHPDSGDTEAIQVAIRVRPFLDGEKRDTIMTVSGTRVVLRHPVLREERVWPDLSHTFNSCQEMSSSRLGAPLANQEAVFHTIGKRILKHLFDGINCCVFTYGQAGSGKSYTLFGDKDDEGLTPRICNHLMKWSGSVEGQCFIEASLYELTPEKVVDLLGSTGATPSKAKGVPQRSNLRVREHPELGPYVDGLTAIPITSQQHMQAVLQLARTKSSPQTHLILELTLRQRFTDSPSSGARAPLPPSRPPPQPTPPRSAPTSTGGDFPPAPLRRSSSLRKAPQSFSATRRLSILTDLQNVRARRITFDAASASVTGETECHRWASLTLCDLAGVQNFGSANGPKGEQKQAATRVNQSLSTLSRVMGLLSDDSRHGSTHSRILPHRECLLTWLLKEKLSGNCKTYLIAAITPCRSDYETTLATLSFAERARRVVCRPRVNFLPPRAASPAGVDTGLYPTLAECTQVTSLKRIVDVLEALQLERESIQQHLSALQESNNALLKAVTASRGDLGDSKTRRGSRGRQLASLVQSVEGVSEPEKAQDGPDTKKVTPSGGGADEGLEALEAKLFKVHEAMHEQTSALALLVKPYCTPQAFAVVADRLENAFTPDTNGRKEATLCSTQGMALMKGRVAISGSGMEAALNIREPAAAPSLHRLVLPRDVVQQLGPVRIEQLQSELGIQVVSRESEEAALRKDAEFIDDGSRQGLLKDSPVSAPLDEEGEEKPLLLESSSDDDDTIEGQRKRRLRNQRRKIYHVSLNGDQADVITDRDTLVKQAASRVQPKQHTHHIVDRSFSEEEVEEIDIDTGALSVEWVTRRWNSITEACRLAVDGDIISVRPGVYNERIYVVRGFTVRGDGPASRVVIEYKGMEPAVHLRCSLGVVENMTIRKHTGECAVHFAGGTGTLRNCNVTSSSTRCSVLVSEGSPLIEGNTITAWRIGVWVVGRSKCVVRDNTITRCGDCAVVVEGHGARPLVEGNSLVAGKGGGIAIGKQGRGRLVKNKIAGNECAGVLLDGRANPTIEGNEVKENAGGGMVICGDGTRGHITGNVFTRNADRELLVTDHSLPKVEGNHFAGGPLFGAVYCHGGGGLFYRNTLENYRTFAVLIRNGGGGFLYDNEVKFTEHSDGGCLVIGSAQGLIVNNVFLGPEDRAFCVEHREHGIVTPQNPTVRWNAVNKQCSHYLTLEDLMKLLEHEHETRKGSTLDPAGVRRVCEALRVSTEA